MAISFPKFSDAEKAGTLAVASKIIAATPGTDPKAAAVSAALATLHALCQSVALPALDQAVLVTNMMATTAPGTPEYNATMNANVGTGLDRYREMLGLDVFNAIASDVGMEQAPDRTQVVAKALADAVIAAATPTESARGKFLSALGIVKKDLDALGKGTIAPSASGGPVAPPATNAGNVAQGAPVPPPPPPAPAAAPAPAAGAVPAMSEAELLAAMGLGPAPAAAAPAKGGRGSKAPKSTEAAAAAGDLALAFKAFGDSQDLDTVARATELGVGRATLLNWMNGKTKPKLDKEKGKQHVQMMIADIDMRGAALAKAREEFNKILGGLG